MSRIRTIKPEWREDQKLARAGLAGRVLSVAVITLADDEGRGTWREPVMAAEVFGYEQESSRVLREALASLSGWFLEVYAVRSETYFQILNWDRHQRVDKKTASRIPPVASRDDGGSGTPNTPTNPPSRESLSSESREPREDVASDSDAPRESLAPGPRTVDLGPRTVDLASRARDAGPLARREALLARLLAALGSGWDSRYLARLTVPSPSVHQAELRPLATWCAEYLETHATDTPEALTTRLLDAFWSRPDLKRPAAKWLAEDPLRYVTGVDAREPRKPRKVTDRLPPGTGAGFPETDIDVGGCGL